MSCKQANQFLIEAFKETSKLLLELHCVSKQKENTWRANHSNQWGNSRRQDHPGAHWVPPSVIARKSNRYRSLCDSKSWVAGCYKRRLERVMRVFSLEIKNKLSVRGCYDRRLLQPMIVAESALVRAPCTPGASICRWYTFAGSKNIFLDWCYSCHSIHSTVLCESNFSKGTV